MECPHCHQTIQSAEGEEPNLVECQACQSQSMPDAKYCYNCGQDLSGDVSQEDGQQVCANCAKTARADDNYCAGCGQSLSADEGMETDAEDEPAAKAPKKRKACSDGMCIGIIGSNGKCTECGKPYSGPAE